MISHIASILFAAAAAGQAQPAARSEPTIVVTAPIADYRAALAACLARSCPVDEDVTASLTLAEALVQNGEYQDAHQVIRRSIDRNATQATRFPEPVSDLYRANGRVTRHLGLDHEAQRSMHQVLSALQAGLPREDHRHFTARLELASTLIAFRRYPEARSQLARLTESARAAGRDDVVQLAQLRSIWVDYQGGDRNAAQRRLERLAAAADPRQSILAAGARRMLIQVYRDRGRQADADRLAAAVGPDRAGGRTLLSAPRYQLSQSERLPREEGYVPAALTSGNVMSRASDNFEDQWIDVAYRILPDGNVTDVTVVRRGGSVDWATSLLASIRGRRFSPAQGATARLERYTYIAPLELRAGSHIPQRSPRARVEYLDLSPPAGATAFGPNAPVEPSAG